MAWNDRLYRLRKTAAFLQMERLPCDGNIWQAEAAAAAGPRADLQFMSSCPPQEGLVATHLFKHQDQELEHHDGKVAKSAGREEKRDEKKRRRENKSHKTQTWLYLCFL